MPQPYEKTTSPTGDIPKPELNPMTNPVLGRHLGRWAEAYFTTPIEQREQAVMELLHQLEREEENGAPPDSSPRFEARELPVAVKQNLNSIDDLENPTDRLAALEEAIRQFEAPKFAADRLEENPPRQRDFDARTVHSPGICPVCQHSNQSDQWYCGMCGFRLRPDDDDAATRVLSFPDSAAKGAPFRTTAPIESVSNDAQPTKNFSFSMFGEPLETSATRPSMWPLETVEELPSSRVGAKVAAACVILLIAATTFVYRGKIGGFVTTWLDSRQTVPTTPHQSVAQPAPAPPANDSSSAEQPAQASATRDQTPSRANEVSSAVPPHEDRSSGFDNEKNLAGKSNTNPTPPTPEKKPLKTSAGRDETDSARSAQSSGRPIESGNEELARARTLLSGGSRSADPAQASIWLWKAVGKNNGAAIILLADLYAHGNGVPQSCDQARILLSAAARKGSVEATQKLREIQTQCAGR